MEAKLKERKEDPAIAGSEAKQANLWYEMRLCATSCQQEVSSFSYQPDQKQ
jgi:hypothetical protein